MDKGEIVVEDNSILLMFVDILCVYGDLLGVVVMVEVFCVELIK